ncbi:MAG: hypothetical protein Q8J97_05500 [Flavobacteriaceae bacterium]|nr:hypothetical protein [Flavobacteriaceae bacterium]
MRVIDTLSEVVDVTVRDAVVSSVTLLERVTESVGSELVEAVKDAVPAENVLVAIEEAERLVDVVVVASPVGDSVSVNVVTNDRVSVG